MTRLFLGLGSNIEPARYLPLGLSELEGLLGSLRVSPVYEGAAIGFSGAPFWNLVVEAQTSLSVGELQSALRTIEYAHGRAKNASRLSPRSLDIDILIYGDACGVVDGVVLPRGEILQNAFVLRPLAELAPDAVHPGVKKSFGELWAKYDAASQPLTPVSLDDVSVRN
ncbi:2-amino-4-hydroxy-6-hydroxymethyldihydropteridine pyrophosphokinase [gamma proteobacterium NOR5-3]|nr:2-amino-4-hydroxy-6-hydroxymethyldihydropteridine pyrophosphokinase [gamma proteobacterium NOR5-3]